MRGAAVVALAVVLGGLLLVVAGVNAPPLSRTCAPTVSEVTCAEAVEGALKRGLAPLHPLIVRSHVEPGPAAEVGALGHKSTVTFDLLGVPGSTSVRMYYDMGGHWGGEVDRSDDEVVLWTLGPLIVAGLLSVAVLGLAWAWRRRETATG